MKNKEGATAQEIIDFLNECLEPEFGDMALQIDTGPRIGPEDSVYVRYAGVAKGSPRIDIENALSSGLFSIYAAPGEKWPRGGKAPAKLKVEQVRGGLYQGTSFIGTPKILMRAKSGTPEKVVEYLIKFFMDNKSLMRREGYAK